MTPDLPKLVGLKQAIIGALLLGALSTLGDFIWEMWISSHRTLFGMLHGAILCLCLGLVLGYFAGTRRSLLVGGAVEMVIGLLAAGSYYLLYGLMSYWAMLASWMLLWIFTSMLNSRINQALEGIKEAVVRGLLAAVLGGLAFWGAVSVTWLSPKPEGPVYWLNLVAWFGAFLPGFACLLVRVNPRRAG